MEHYKISKLLNYSTVSRSRFVTKKSIEVNDLSSGQYSDSKNIRFKTSMLKSDLCGYSDAYIDVKERISVTGTENANRRNKKLTFNYNSTLRSRISKINNTFIDNPEDLGIVMPMYNLLEYSNTFSMTSGSLWNYYKDEVNDSANETDNKDNMINNKTSKSFKYNAKIIGRISNSSSRLNAEDVVPLKYLINFWKFLDFPLINCKIEFDLTYPKYQEHLEQFIQTLIQLSMKWKQ